MAEFTIIYNTRGCSLTAKHVALNLRSRIFRKRVSHEAGEVMSPSDGREREYLRKS